MGKQISISNYLKTILVIIGVVGGIYAFVQFIDFRIEHTVNNEQFIKKVSSHVRPFVIFDENETIFVDGGAMQYLDKIEVEQVMRREGSYPGLNIIITPKSHLTYAPLLETFAPTMYNVTYKRGSQHQWIYKLTAELTLGPDDEKEPSRFRLEILR